MATTLTVQNAINFAQPILKNQPLLVSNCEPALSAANMVLGTMLGAPFRWRFNRATFNFAITKAGGTDYQISIGNFGFLEDQWLVNAEGQNMELGGALSLAKDSAVLRPKTMAVQYDDNAGNLTFRMSATPDQNYTVFGDYQMKAGVLTSPASTWGVVPDEFAYIFYWGFLCYMSLLTGDSRFPIFEGYFISHLLGAQDGLSEQEKNIFIGNWTALTATLQRSQGMVQAGLAGRGK